MKTSSAKAKGRRGAQEVVALLLKHAPSLTGDDIKANTGSVPGEDIHFSPLARSIYPISSEVKNVEKLNIYTALKQASVHAEKNLKKNISTEPVVFFRRNKTKLYVAVDAEYFVKLLIS